MYGDYLLFSQIGQDRLLLNLGGIANFTYLPASGHPDAMFSTDVGTGNTLVDAFAQDHFGLAYDAEGRMAATGTVHPALLAALLDNPFFAAPFPKTTGPELFSRAYVRAALARSHATALAPADLLATLTQFSAEGVVRAVRQQLGAATDLRVYASGGGMHNPVLMAAIRRGLPGCQFYTTDALGIAPDAKEAVLFAVLANETLAGEQVSFGTNRPGLPSVSLGKVSFPG